MRQYKLDTVAELISVVITTYNREDALDAVLRALAGQSDRDFEVVVADDGSRPSTGELVAAWKGKFGRPLSHVWHEDRGFRAAEIRNRAILASRGAYLIFLDGDCLPRADFVAAHRRLAEPGWFVTGNRILLSPDLTEKVLREKLAPENWSFATFFAQRLRGGVNRLAALVHLPLGPCGGCGETNGRARARPISRSGVPISRASTVSMPTTAAGARKIPTSSCACCAPA